MHMYVFNNFFLCVKLLIIGLEYDLNISYWIRKCMCHKNASLPYKSWLPSSLKKLSVMFILHLLFAKCSHINFIILSWFFLFFFFVLQIKILRLRCINKLAWDHADEWSPDLNPSLADSWAQSQRAWLQDRSMKQVRRGCQCTRVLLSLHHCCATGSPSSGTVQEAL